MARKVFISFLGTNNYVECCYDIDTTNPVRFVQEALIRNICKDWTENDLIYIFCTEDAEKSNWVDGGQKKIFEEIEKIGLQTRLNSLNLKCNIKEERIDEGFSEDGIWTIFETVYSKLNECDEIYFDVTHAFRSIPMFSTVLFNFSRFMKGTNVVSIKYGAFEKLGPAFEVRQKTLDNRGIAPILDLTNIVHLQTLTRIADDFKAYGKTSNVFGIFDSNLSNTKYNSLVRDLKKWTSALEEYILLNRVEQIKEGVFVQIINNAINSMQKLGQLTVPQDNLLNEIKKELSSFSVNGGDNNIIAAINWAIKFNMIQQAYTMAEEFLISLAAEKYKDKCFCDDILKWRNYMSSIMSVDKRKIDNGQFTENIDLAKELLSMPEILKIRRYYPTISLNRNILCHGKKCDLSLNNFKKQLQNNFQECLSTFKSDTLTKSKQSSSIFINLSNHPSTSWSESQLAAAGGKVTDLSFPQIDPDGDEAYIEQLANEYYNKIKAIHGVTAVHLMGEMNFTFALVTKLKAEGIKCVASTTKRETVEENGVKISKFNFVRFRSY